MIAKKKDAANSSINRILQVFAKERDLSKRIDVISEHLMGCPYVVNSLGGGLDLPEQLTIKLDGFDCVTYLETVLALALAKTSENFADYLRSIRYKNGELDWQKRNHYMVDWWRNNEKQSLIQNLTRGTEAIEKTRELNLVKGLQSKRTTFRVFPKKNLKRVEKLIKTGDLVCFSSTKKNLDVFHAGILIRRNDKILLRHATRTAGKVIEQDLQEFLQHNRMPGFVLLSPTKNK